MIRIAAVMTCLLLACPLQAGLVGYWTFDGDVLDASGTGNDGELIGGTYVNTVPPALGTGQALSFQDPSEHVLVAADPSLNSKIFTLSMFINDQEQFSGMNRLTSRASDSFETAIDKVFGTDSLSYYSSAVGWIRTGEIADLDEWNHVAYVSDGETMTVYLNGSEAFGPEPFLASPAGFMHIGNRWNDLEGFFGMMDEVAMWDVALPGEAIADLAAGTKRAPEIPVGDPPPPPPMPFLSVVSDADTWKLSTVTDDGGPAGEWIPSGDLPPFGPATYTLDALPTEPGVVGHIDAAASALDVGGIQADNDIHYYRTTFDLDRTNGFTTEIQLAADNGAELYLNGQLVATETSFLVENWGAPLPSLSIDETGSIASTKFEDAATSYTGWKVGENELVLTLRNPFEENSPAGGFAFRMDFFSSAATMSGDFNSDGRVDVVDINLLSAAVAAGQFVNTFDLNQDSFVDERDLDVMIVDIVKTYFGDANLDGEFNSADFVSVFTAGEYEDALIGNSTWATGDWNGDLEFSSSDFVKAFSDGGYENGPRTAVAAVPEPAAALLCGFAILGLLSCRSVSLPRNIS